MNATSSLLPKEIMVGMLRKGSTGNQILDILDVIASENQDNVNVDNTEVSAA